MAVIEREARSVAMAFGVSASDEMAAALVDRLLRCFGGERVYLPRRRALDTEIRKRFTGSNHVTLAQELGCSVSTIRRALRAAEK